MHAILLVALAVGGWIDDRATGFSGGPLAAGICLPDDEPVGFGDGATAACGDEPYELVYDSSDGQFELWSLDCDNSATSCAWVQVADGTDDLLLSGTIAGLPASTDAAPRVLGVSGANAWSQATGGNRTGGALRLGGGIGTRQIVCSDRTLTDTDTVTITIDGSATTLTESTDFDCEGEASEEVCCDNIGAAITTADIGLTPDCATLAGTCYLEPAARLSTVNLAVADGGVNGTGWTLVESTDGATAIAGLSPSLVTMSGSLTCAPLGDLLLNPNSTAEIVVDANGLRADDAAGPAVLNEAASATNPTVVPNRADATTGIGAQASGNISAVVGGAEQWRQTAGAMTFQVATDIAGGSTLDLSATGNQSITPSGDVIITPAGGDTDITGTLTATGACDVDSLLANTGPVSVDSNANGLCYGDSGATCTDGKFLFDGTDCQWSCASATNGIQVNTSMIVGPTQVTPDTGFIQLWNQENDAIGAGNPFAICGGLESSNLMCIYAEGDGGGGAQNRRVGLLDATTAANPPQTSAELEDTNAYLTLTSSVEEDSDGGRESRVDFRGEQSGGEQTVLARIEASHSGTGDDEKGQLTFSVNNGTDGTSPAASMVLDETDLSVYDDSGNGLYWQEYHLGAEDLSPGTSGATQTLVNNASIVYLLNATNEYLYHTSDIHDNWDGTSDIVVNVRVMLAAAETANDDIEAEVVAEYWGEHEDGDTNFKTQTRSVNHDIGNYNAQGSTHDLIFVLDYDLVDNVIESDDTVKIRFRLDAVGSVAGVHVIKANIRYRTAKPAESVGTFPTEG